MVAEGRRRFLRRAGALGGLAVASPAWAAGFVDLDLPGGPNRRPLTTAFPEKGAMILQRTRPPLLETPFEVFDKGVLTPNDQFYVRWHWANIPTQVDVSTFKLNVHGAVDQTLSLSLSDLLAMPPVEFVAVNQCSGNSRGLFQPRVPGAQWENGAMGNARWTGVRLREVLDRAGVKRGSLAVRFAGLDEAVTPDAPKFMKSLDIDHARDGEVMIAWLMNGAQLPLLNGFPTRLVVPGWYSTYWVKMLSNIEVLAAPDDNYWMATAYRIPDTPDANVTPGETGFKTTPINRMTPRSFFTSVRTGTQVAANASVPVRGIAFGGDCGVSIVELSGDGGRTWRATTLGPDYGPYSFRQWSEQVVAPASGALSLDVRCTNTRGARQRAQPIWNGAGFMRSGIERVELPVRQAGQGGG
jgi:DMSO/TMAO reductase YedYZ molybdopterin-dependent catalytic subunit